MAKQTLNNKEFLDTLSKCCENGKIDDEQMNRILGAYFPYNLTFKGDKGWELVTYAMENLLR